jgi:hypothetical protein
MCVTSECHLAGLGNVRVVVCAEKQVLTISFIYVVHAMQSEFTGPLKGKGLTIETDYAINNNLTPFISMQNHYNLIYREEEREMFPTIKVGITSILSFRSHL